MKRTDTERGLSTEHGGAAEGPPPARRERRGAWLRGVVTVLFVATSAGLAYLDRSLVTAAAPHGIVSFELAGSVERSRAVLESWAQPARDVAFRIQSFDFLYLVVYPLWLFLMAERAGARLGGRWGRAGSRVAWAALGAAPLDAVENYALLQQLLHGPTSFHAALAWGCAVAKFGLVGLAAAFLLLAGAERTRRLVQRRADPGGSERSPDRVDRVRW